MAEREKATSGGFVDQEVSFESELPARGGVLEYSDVLDDVARAARLDRADKALDAMANCLAILTTQNGDASAAILLSTLATASQHPPRVSVAVQKQSKACGLLMLSGMFAVNFLSIDQKALAERLALARGDEALQGVEYDRGVNSGCAVLRRALGFIECRMVERLDSGDHMLFVADLLDGGAIRDGESLVVRGAYKPTVDISENLSVGS